VGGTSLCLLFVFLLILNRKRRAKAIAIGVELRALPIRYCQEGIPTTPGSQEGILAKSTTPGSPEGITSGNTTFEGERSESII